MYSTHGGAETDVGDEESGLASQDEAEKNGKGGRSYEQRVRDSPLEKKDVPNFLWFPFGRYCLPLMSHLISLLPTSGRYFGLNRRGVSE